MGIWDYICSSSDSLKRNTPDLTAVKGWCWSPYGYGLAAVTKIDSVRINATQMLTQYMSDEETRSRLCLLATDLAKNAAVYGCQEGLKSFPGGTLLYNIIVRSINGEEELEGHEAEMIKALQAMVKELEERIKKSEIHGEEELEGHEAEMIKALQAKVKELEERIKKSQSATSIKSKL